MFLPVTREPDPSDMYTFFVIASLMGGRAPTGTHEHRPGDPLVAKRHSYHFCDFSQWIVCFFKKLLNKMKFSFMRNRPPSPDQ